MRCLAISWAIVLIAGSCSGSAESQAVHEPGGAPVEPGRPAPARHVIVVSIDGLLPASYMEPDAHGLSVPTLRRLRAQGAYSAGAASVFPSVTYPAHTSIVTGVQPSAHGIHGNYALDPLRRNHSGWNWYAEEIRAPTLWQVAEAAGMRTALIHWPVTVGARVDALVPDFWRARTGDDIKLSRAVSTPGLLDAVAARFPGFYSYYEPWKPSDRSAMDVAIHLLETQPPELMLIHTLKVDTDQHDHGLWSAEARGKIEEADRQLGRLMQAVERAGLWPRTILVVLSDHGFLPVHTRVRLAHMLKALDLVPADESDNLSFARASVISSGGTAYFYLTDPADDHTARLLRGKLEEMAKQPGSGIGRVLDREAIRALGGDARALLAVEASDGYRFSSGWGGTLYTDVGNQAAHGHLPDRPELRASLLIYGPAIEPGAIAGARLIDVAPTVAKWLGLTLPRAVEGRPLAVGAGPGQVQESP